MEGLTKRVQNVTGTKLADEGTNAASTTTCTGSFTCLGAQACNCPSFDLSITGDCLPLGFVMQVSHLKADKSGHAHISGARGTISVHQQNQQHPQVVSGAAFEQNIFVSVDHSLITKNGSKYEFAYISLKGLGIMKGGIMTTWSQRKVW